MNPDWNLRLMKITTIIWLLTVQCMTVQSGFLGCPHSATPTDDFCYYISETPFDVVETAKFCSKKVDLSRRNGYLPSFATEQEFDELMNIQFFKETLIGKKFFISGSDAATELIWEVRDDPFDEGSKCPPPFMRWKTTDYPIYRTDYNCLCVDFDLQAMEDCQCDAVDEEMAIVCQVRKENSSPLCTGLTVQSNTSTETVIPFDLIDELLGITPHSPPEALELIPSETSIMNKVQELVGIYISNYLSKNHEFQVMKESYLTSRYDFIKYCETEGYQCNLESDIGVAHIPLLHSVCYTIEAPTRYDFVTRKQTLRLVLDPHEDDYIGSSFRTGIKFLVTGQGDYPHIDQYGSFVPPGLHVQVDISKEKLIRNLSKDDKRLLSPADRTQEACLRNYYQMALSHNCSCLDYRFMNNDEYSNQTLRKEFKLCDMENLCYEYMAANQQQIMNQAMCHSSRVHNTFYYTTSYSNSLSHFGISNITGTNGLISMDLHFDSMRLTVITESYLITLLDVFTFFCNYAGIFIGLTVIEMSSWLFLAVQSVLAILCSPMKFFKHEDMII